MLPATFLSFYSPFLLLPVTWAANGNWDYITFAQSWPSTTCVVWKQRSSTNSCNLPPNPSQWTIHGIWPSKAGKKSPSNCSTRTKFDENQLRPMLGDLRNYWTDVHANKETFSFWKYQWEKHRSCSVDSQQLNSISNYFRKGLEWNRKYNLFEILNESNITLDNSGYTARQLSLAVKAVTRKNPRIQCETDKVTKESVLSEIRICFDRSLQIQDCDLLDPNVPKQDGVLTNCDKSKRVMYYAAKDPGQTPDSEDDTGVDIGLFIFLMFVVICVTGFLIYMKKYRKRPVENYTNFE